MRRKISFNSALYQWREYHSSSYTLTNRAIAQVSQTLDEDRDLRLEEGKLYTVVGISKNKYRVRNAVGNLFWVDKSLLTKAESQAQQDSCEECGERIVGSFVRVDGKAYHPRHFTCSKCGNSVKATYRMEGGQPICSDCFE